MRTRPLGRSGLNVSVISFGAWPIMGRMGSISDEEAIRTIHAAVDAGMTFIDTAEAYGPMLGAAKHSEQLLGEALDGRRDRVCICTKVSGGNNSPEHIESAAANSSRMLKTDHVDVYMLHGFDPNPPLEKSMAALNRLRSSGKARAIGVSNFTPEQLTEAMKFGQIDCHQLKYHMLFRAEAITMMPMCQKSGVGVTTHSTPAKGLLSGRYRPGHRCAAEDERSKIGGEIGPFQGDGLARTLEVADRLKEWAADRGRTLPQLAIAWVLTHPAVSSAIIGPKRQDQVAEFAAAAYWILSSAELQEIDAIQNGFELVGPKGYRLPD